MQNETRLPQQRQQTGAIAVSNRKDIRDVIMSQESEIARALPKHMKADRMIRVMLTAINSTPKLLACTKESLLSALMKCSQYGLEPDGRHAHLIPYKKGKGAYEVHECQLIFDYKGLVNLVRRSGDVTDIHCDVVYEKDDFEFSFGTESTLKHRPNLRDKDRGEITCAYSFVKLKDGSTSFEVMPWWEIEAVKEGSQGYQAFVKGYTSSNPWDTNWSEMAKKTVFRRHTKWLPLSFELAEQINADDDRQSEESRFAKAKPAVESSVTMLHAPTAEPQVEQQPEAAEPEPQSEPTAEVQADFKTGGVAGEKVKAGKPEPVVVTPQRQLVALATASQISHPELVEASLHFGWLDKPVDTAADFCAAFPEAVAKTLLKPGKLAAAISEWKGKQ